MSRAAQVVTWFFLSATLVVLLLAGGLLLSADGGSESGAEGVTEVEPSDTSLTTDQGASEANPPPEEAAALGLDTPWDVSKELVDAQRRAKIWSTEACLSEVRVVVQHGERQIVEMSYGVAEGRAMPGAALKSKRLLLSYDTQGLASKREDTASTGAKCLPDPNCPLSAAVFAARQAGARTEESAGGLYLRSAKYDRPIWTISAPGMPLFHVDGHNCALLQR